MLSLQARKQFKLSRDPFTDDIAKPEDVYTNERISFAAEYLYQTAKGGGIMALLGESGSGKTTVRRLATDRWVREEQKVRMIVPRCIDKSRLTTGMICDAIVADCSTESPRRTLEGKARQVERILTNSSRSGWNHVLVIEEAHDLSIATLKYLKRFWELEDGFKKLLAIVLVGQLEMKAKLDESKNWEAREVIRRIEVVELDPLADKDEIGEYLQLKFDRLGRQLAEVISPSGIEALATRLRRTTREGVAYSVAFPLLVNNWTRRALNLAADLGADLVDAEVVMSL